MIMKTKDGKTGCVEMVGLHIPNDMFEFYEVVDGVVKLPKQPTKLSDLTNDVGYITTCDKPSFIQRIKNLFKK